MNIRVRNPASLIFLLVWQLVIKTYYETLIVIEMCKRLLKNEKMLRSVLDT